MPNVIRRVFRVAMMSIFLFGHAVSAAERILVQSTTSTQNSGFYEYILPIFEEETGIRVDIVAVGTGQAIRNARNGDADVLLVHAKAAEEQFVADGFGLERFDLMFNDFVIVGPASDPDRVAQAKDLKSALTAIWEGNTPFVSRGDDSGTHKKERALWRIIGKEPGPGLGWYRETGAGMGATIRVAVEINGYTITDRATWIAYKKKHDHRILFEGAREMFNQYGIIQVDPARFPHANVDGARTFIDWMLSPKGQNLIAGYSVDGQQLFFPNAAR
ncbi:MAG: substrate-binding domain-containing protein [Paracoccaceae bacterium]